MHIGNAGGAIVKYSTPGLGDTTPGGDSFDRLGQASGMLKIAAIGIGVLFLFSALKRAA